MRVPRAWQRFQNDVGTDIRENRRTKTFCCSSFSSKSLRRRCFNSSSHDSFSKKQAWNTRANRCWIGVAQGKNARNILELLNISRLYLVDPYLPYAEIKGNVLKTLDPRTFRQSALKTLKPFSDRIEFICETSEDAVDLVANNLDFVYIDGNHSYEFVRKDIENYYPKLNSDGIIGGHDFCPMYFGVCKAVVESAEKYDVQLWGNNGDWFFIS